MFPPLHSGATDYGSLSSVSRPIGHHLSAVSCATRAVGKGQAPRMRNWQTFAIGDQYSHPTFATYGESWFGNSHAMAEQFAEGAKSSGHQVELISLRGKEIKFCVGCLSCQKTGACVFKDDVPAIMDSVLNADVVCWATPIYYYEMSGQMKTLIDRMNAMYPKDYRFRDIYLLTTAAENEEFVPKRAEGGLTGWIDCYGKSALKGYVFCGGVNDPNDIAGNAKLQEAYEMGKKC